MNYKLIRSRRKTLAIHITKNAELEVRAPLQYPKTEIDRFVSLKRVWIEKHLGEKQKNLAKKYAFHLDYGDLLLLQGKYYPITANSGKQAGFDGVAFYMLPGLSAEAIKQTAIQIYKTAAKQILADKIEVFSRQMNFSPTAVKINSAKTRWGSCSGKNTVNFSWRLIMAEDKAIDYVIVHELAHMKEHNHSHKFWALVASVLPDYKERQNGLKELQAILAIQDWDEGYPQ